MSLISLLVILIVVGVMLYIVSLIPMDATVRKIITALVVLLLCLWLLDIFVGIGPHIGIVRTTR